MCSAYKKICEEISDTAVKCGRNPKEISLVAVTKGMSWEEASFFYDQGQRDFGENRVAEALDKKLIAPADCRWHFIGNLQKNKVRKVVGNFALIHSVDSFELAEKLSTVSLEMNIRTPILLQVNISGEISKQGYTPEEWRSCIEKVMQLPGITVEGLMTMAPLTEDEEQVRKCFRGLRLFGEDLRKISGCPLPHLSMGMSHDFKIAIEEGATLLRIGNALRI